MKKRHLIGPMFLLYLFFAPMSLQARLKDRLAKIPGSALIPDILLDSEKLVLPHQRICGTTPIDKLIPEAWGRANFQRGCYFHDNCYNDCAHNRAYCDSHFYELLKEECHLKYVDKKVNRNICLRLAKMYYTAVNRLGEKPYFKSQVTGGCISEKSKMVVR